MAGITEPQTLSLKGTQMKTLKTINNAWLLIENGLILSFGEMKNLPESKGVDILNVSGQIVLPAFVDSHTHLVFAEWREHEFIDRINGLSYQEIAAKGGGILNSAEKLAQTSEEVLLKFALTRIEEVMKTGTGAIEIKSGYGLNLDAEMKMLRVIKKLKEIASIPIKSTLLGAHAVPLKYRNNKADYLKIVTNEMIPLAASEGLADFVDVFCEKNNFIVEDMLEVINAGKKHGLRAKVHVNQFNILGGVPAAVGAGALSVDHLEVMNDIDFDALISGNTIPTALPGCSFFLDLPYAPARRMIDSGLPLCLASDYNPGSSPSGNMQFIVSLACIKQHLLPAEAINAATINGAASLGLSHELGSIAVGKKANIIITKEIPSIDFIPYSFGGNVVDKLIVGGHIID